MRSLTSSLTLAATLAASLAATLMSSGCADAPARGFEHFYEALGLSAALTHLSARARAGLDPQAAAALMSTPPRLALKRVRVVSESADVAVLEVEDALGAKERVTMVREQGAWRVDL